jgi:hypothetical protein
VPQPSQKPRSLPGTGFAVACGHLRKSDPDSFASLIGRNIAPLRQGIDRSVVLAVQQVLVNVVRQSVHLSVPGLSEHLGTVHQRRAMRRV